MIWSFLYVREFTGYGLVTNLTYQLCFLQACIMDSK